MSARLSHGKTNGGLTMARHREELLWTLEDRLSTLSKWLAARRQAGERDVEQLRAHLDSLRGELRERAARSGHHAVARARATLDDMDRELEAPPGPATIGREELDATRRHVRLTAALLPHVYDVDDRAWRSAHEEYERSWDEIVRLVERRRSPSR